MYIIIGIRVLVIASLFILVQQKGKALYARLALERERRQAEKDKSEKAEKSKEDEDRKENCKGVV